MGGEVWVSVSAVSLLGRHKAAIRPHLEAGGNGKGLTDSGAGEYQDSF